MKSIATTLFTLFLFTFTACNTAQEPTSESEPTVETDVRDADFQSLFNGEDLSGWVVPEDDGGHWRVVDGVIDYDALSEAEEDKNLWSEESYGDFVLRLEWRLTETPYINEQVRFILPDGTHKKGLDGEDILISLPDSDSGVFVRGSSKAQINIWNWPVGSGEVYGYRTDGSMPDDVRAGVTPSVHADNDLGEWNEFEITMKGDRLTVVLNDITVIENAELPGIAEEGPIALQHHGGMRDGEWYSPPSIVQFRNIEILEL